LCGAERSSGGQLIENGSSGWVGEGGEHALPAPVDGHSRGQATAWTRASARAHNPISRPSQSSHDG
jgi:hypothetical protein